MTIPPDGDQPSNSNPNPQQAQASAGLEKRRRTMLIGAIAAVVALVGGLLITFGLTQNTQETAAAVDGISVEAGPEVFLEPAQSIGSDAFFPDTSALVDVEPVFIPAVARPDDGKETGEVETVSGSEPGLYGGTRDNARCNRLKLVEFLEAHPDKGAAWAVAQDIDPGDIRLFVDALTPVVLLHDTRVTNHGFVDGRANPIQSVMQAGTAVLVDSAGLPRVRCACGNPLRKPIPQTTVRYSGEPWSAFSADNVQVIAPGAASGQLVLQDLEGGPTFARTTGSTGDQDFEAPPAAVAAIRPELVVVGLGDQNVAQPTGGRVTLGSAAIADGQTDGGGELIFVDSFTPIEELGDDIILELFGPEGAGVIQEASNRADVVPAGETPDSDQAADPTAIPPAQATSAPTTADSEPVATSAPERAATPTSEPAIPAATATPAPAPPPAATAVPVPTATPAPTATPEPPPTATPPPRQVVDLTRQGSVSANSTFTGFPVSAVIDGDVSTSWFSTGPAVGPGVVTWSGPRTELTDVVFIGNASHANPEFRSGFGFASVTVEVLDGGSVVYSSTGGGEGWSWAPGVVGDTVRLTFSGHQDPQCGGFGELIIKGLG